ncbi:hypothetical protein ER13_02210 [Brevundimonas sp. EAKA]|uniref:hypothetical protein n=1 Tax=Brevundimonas sp. EAKA TaxID=1495854 RepID=UPI0004A995E6|nr:hypothetical protein [Brevundimonas sp. EAKA]KDP95410.1 hypothetical protein ER13_02210 [Brevundimonas sp. EAKA]
MIQNLNVAKAAYFYEVTARITDQAVDGLFRDLRRQAIEPTQNLFRHDREDLNGVRWSAICFAYHRDPGFLDPPPRLKERVYGFLMLVEHQGKVAVLKSGLDLTAAFKARHLDRMDAERVEAALAHSDAIFEKMRLRNLSPSKHVLRSKMLESEDLRNVVGPAGGSRFAPQGYTLRRDDGHYTTTPSTGRISQRSDTAGHEELVPWCVGMIEELGNQNAEVAPFLRTFARSVSLATYGARLQPTFFSVNTALLAEELLDEHSPLRLVRQNGQQPVALSHDEMVEVLEGLGTSLAVRMVRKELRLEPTEGRRRTLGKIKINKGRISLRSLDLSAAESLTVERADLPVGQDPGGKSLRSYINSESRFVVLFDDLALAYIDGTLYRDDVFAAGGEDLLRYLLTERALADTVSEKGGLTAVQTAFDPTSVFGVVVNQIAHQDDVLLCDDLSDEWADFIGLNTRATPPTVTFYHAKHKGLSLGASPFHEAVSQALKNLGNMALPESEMGRKVASWEGVYTKDRVTSAIDRVVRGDIATVADAIGAVRSTPDTMRRAYVVTSSLSKQRVSDALVSIKAGNAPSPHFVQLYWLLMTFVSACSEVGAFGRVVCQE